MSKVRIVKRTDGFEVWGCSECGMEKYYDRVTASNLINVHPETLTRLYRNQKGDTNPLAGLKIGSDLFFTREHLSYLGYIVSEDDTSQAEDDEMALEAELEKNMEDADIRITNSEEELPW